MVFQDPFSSLNPRMTPLKDIVGEPLRVNNVVPESELEDRVVLLLLRKVGLRPEYLPPLPERLQRW